jgi:mannosyltransferase OCH1-like enzyme
MIPKIIHQCWYGLEGPLEESPKYHKGYEITADMHPDYEHILWNRETSRQLLADNFPKYLELYDSFRYDIQRMDFDRFVYMAVYGGFYVDLDVWPLKSLNGLMNERLILHSSDNFVPSQAKFTNNFIGS